MHRSFGHRLIAERRALVTRCLHEMQGRTNLHVVSETSDLTVDELPQSD